MGKKSLFFAFVLVIALLSGCGKRKPVLHLYSWADYFSPEAIEMFEKEFNCRVQYDTFDSNEALLAKLQAGASGYDVLVPSHYIIPPLVRDNTLLELDKAKLDNFKNLDPAVVQMLPDPECTYAIPYMLSYTGIGYDANKVKDFEPTWEMFAKSEYKGRMTVLDDYREVIGAALYMLNLDPNTTDEADLEKAKAKVLTWTRNVAKFENEQYKNGLASGEFQLVMGYSGDLMQVIDETDNLKFAIPKEGCMLSTDMLCIPRTAPNPELAHAFINFLHRPDIAVINTEYTFYLCPNKASYEGLSEEIRSNEAVFIDPEILARSRIMKDLGDNISKYTKIWEEIKAAH